MIGDTNRVHVWPRFDPREHVLDHGADCWCEPVIEVVHAEDSRAVIGLLYVHTCPCARQGVEHVDGRCPHAGPAGWQADAVTETPHDAPPDTPPEPPAASE